MPSPRQLLRRCAEYARTQPFRDALSPAPPEAEEMGKPTMGNSAHGLYRELMRSHDRMRRRETAPKEG